MNIKVNKKEFLRVLKHCKSVADSKSTMPVLAHVLIDASESTARLSATDLKVSVRCEIEATTIDPGSVAVNARDLFERVRMMPGSEVSLEVDGKSMLTISSGDVKHVVYGVEKDIFPKLPKPVQGTWVSVDVEILSRLINGTFYAISKDRTRIHLNSALLEIEDGLLRMVATDGHRISKVEVRAPVAGSVSMLIPRDGIETLKRLCAEAKPGEVATFLKSENFIHAYVAGFTFSSKLTDAQFPPYSQVIPKKYSGWARVNRKAFQACVSRALAFANKRHDGLRMTLSGGEMRIECDQPNGHVFRDRLAADYAGDDFTIGLSSRYLLDVLKTAEDDGTVVLRVNKELEPVSLWPSVRTPDHSHVSVIMPMRI